MGCCGPRKEGEDKDEEDMVMRMKTPTTLCLLALRLRRHTSGAPPVTQRMHAGSARPGAAQRSPLSTAHNISYIHVSSQKDVPYIQPVLQTLLYVPYIQQAQLRAPTAESCPYNWMPMTMAKTPIAHVAECFIEMHFGHLLH